MSFQIIWFTRQILPNVVWLLENSAIWAPKYGIPALLAIFRDETESESLRIECTIALGKIREEVKLGRGRPYIFF